MGGAQGNETPLVVGEAATRPAERLLEPKGRVRAFVVYSLATGTPWRPGCGAVQIIVRGAATGTRFDSEHDFQERSLRRPRYSTPSRTASLAEAGRRLLGAEKEDVDQGTGWFFSRRIATCLGQRFQPGHRRAARAPEGALGTGAQAAEDFRGERGPSGRAGPFSRREEPRRAIGARRGGPFFFFGRDVLEHGR